MPSFHWANDVNPISVTPDYILPQEKRPNLTNLSHLISLPVIDMNNENEILVHEISKACEEFGFFMLINHGVSQELCYNVLKVITKFFYLPQQEKAQFFSICHMDDGKISRYYLSDDYQATKKKTDLWCEAFYHTWHPFDLSFIQNLPQSPPNYREIIVSYAKEIGPLMVRLLSLISQGLGLSKHYLQRRLEKSHIYTAQANYYPPCPSPELTLGLEPHTDLKLLSIILQEQGVTGLHVLKDQQWVAVHPTPASLVVNVADQLQVLSNDKYTSVLHRAVTNVKGRVSFATFCGLNKDAVIGPIEDLIDQHHPPMHPNYDSAEFHIYRLQKRKKVAVKHRISTRTTTSSLSLKNITRPTTFDPIKLNINFSDKKSKLLIPYNYVPTSTLQFKRFSTKLI